LLARPDVQRYIDEQVASGSFNRPELEAVFANVELKPNIIAILDKPATSRPWYQFRGSFYNERLLKNGVAFWQQHAATLQRAEQVYGVPPEMVVAILGIETNYGRNTGSFRLADALTTIAFNYPRRAEYFRGELTEFLKLSKEEGIDPLTLKGSYAGAMGCRSSCRPASANGRWILTAAATATSGITSTMPSAAWRITSSCKAGAMATTSSSRLQYSPAWI
jgi:membrane-bound lytic murein transglycosylase B